MQCGFCKKETIERGTVCGKCRRVIEQMVFGDILHANDFCKKLGWAAYRIEFTGMGYKVSELEGY